MTETLVDELQNVGLQTDNVRGQGYDNGSNIKGKHNSVQQRVLDMNLRAFFKVLVDATEVAQDLEIEPQFEKEQSGKRQKKRLFDYEAHEESLEDPSQKFKVEFYYSILEMAIQSVEEKFYQLQSYKAIFGFLYDTHGVKNAPTADILHDCQNLEKS
ncbi:uncharacterized protein [Palaemon carinicauda]|uniref:uncharacterized protein n=1 Tax=Palaemon carinicauda TaxID=392227 RepID=UPI0035B5E89A